jgi:hypothetical protein
VLFEKGEAVWGKKLMRQRPAAFKGHHGGVERWWEPGSVRRHTEDEQGGSGLVLGCHTPKFQILEGD